MRNIKVSLIKKHSPMVEFCVYEGRFRVLNLY
jgi:hypothetical protein